MCRWVKARQGVIDAACRFRGGGSRPHTARPGRRVPRRGGGAGVVHDRQGSHSSPPRPRRSEPPRGAAAAQSSTPPRHGGWATRATPPCTSTATSASRIAGRSGPSRIAISTRPGHPPPRRDRANESAGSPVQEWHHRSVRPPWAGRARAAHLLGSAYLTLRMMSFNSIRAAIR
jgi:hypothetical protein